MFLPSHHHRQSLGISEIKVTIQSQLGDGLLCASWVTRYVSHHLHDIKCVYHVRYTTESTVAYCQDGGVTLLICDLHKLQHSRYAGSLIKLCFRRHVNCRSSSCHLPDDINQGTFWPREGPICFHYSFPIIPVRFRAVPAGAVSTGFTKEISTLHSHWPI